MTHKKRSWIPIAFTLAALAAAPVATSAQEAETAKAEAEAPAAPSPFSEMEQDAINNMIREYILANPEIIPEAIAKAEELEQLRVDLESQLALVEHKEELFNDPNSYIAGNPDGDVTIVEFFDYNCGWCRRATPAIIELLDEDPNIRVVFKEFPIRGQDSDDVSRAAVAAFKQGKYFDLHAEAMQVEGQMDLARFEKMAEDAGLDMDQLRKDMDGPSVDKILDANIKIAQKLYLNGTPSFLVGDRIVRGWPGKEGLLAMIDEVRNPPEADDTPAPEDG